MVMCLANLCIQYCMVCHAKPLEIGYDLSAYSEAEAKPSN